MNNPKLLIFHHQGQQLRPLRVRRRSQEVGMVGDQTLLMVRTRRGDS